MAALYPSGYAGAMRTMEQTAALTTVQRLHPEVWRRMSALMQEAAANGVQLGVGTGWRKQPTDGRPGFAAPGNSYHEGFMPGGRTRPDGVNDRDAMAIDTVLTEAWPWMNANCGRFGFVHFANVGNEPWHIQPVEIPRSRNYATAAPPLRTWPLQEEGLIVTADDLAILNKMRDDIIKAMGPQIWNYLLPHTTPGQPATTANSFLRATFKVTNDLFQGDAPGSPLTEVEATAAVEALLAKINPATITATITAAVTAALEDVAVEADLSAEAIADIAEATAQAVVAEIAS